MRSSPLFPRATRLLAGSALAALALVAACQDSAVGPVELDPWSASLPGSPSQQDSPYFCTTRIFTPQGGYTEGYLPLSFPPEALAADGATTKYQFRAYDAAGRVERQAECVIPRTAEAVRLMSRRFQIPGSVAVPKPIEEDPGDITTQECYLQPDGSYYCDDLAGDGGGSTDPNPTEPLQPSCDSSDPSCGGEEGGTDGGGGSTGGDSGGNTYDTPTGEPIADDETTDCHLADSGNCDLREADPVEVDQVKTEISKIKDDGICGDLKVAAADMVYNQRLWVWDNEVRQGGYLLLGDVAWEYTEPTGTDRMPVMHLWTGGVLTPGRSDTRRCTQWESFMRMRLSGRMG